MVGAFKSSIQKFWERLPGAVHPDDEPIFAAYPHHTFNLKFPPPAFIGSVDAPIVILMSNGGYKPGITEAEFPNEKSESEYRQFIRGEVIDLPPNLSRYYVGGSFARWITNRNAVIVNAVPYRSPRLSQEPYNKRLARRLRSLEIHRQWITDEVLPEAARGRRFVLVHRNGWWEIPKSCAGPCVLFSDPANAEPNRLAPDKEKLALAQHWLDQMTG